MGATQRARIEWLDIAKGIAIILVVLGHAVRGGDINRIIYSFQVPAFFLLAGMTAGGDRIGIRIKNDLYRLIIPYFSFGLLSIPVFILFGTFAAGQLDINAGTSLLKNLFELFYASPVGGALKFNTPLWFLPCLFATKLIFYGLYRLCRGKRLFVLLCSALLAATGFTYSFFKGPSLPLNLSVSLKMLFFFALGNALTELTTKKDLFQKREKALAFGTSALFITFVTAIFAPGVDYTSDSFPGLGLFLLTSLLGSLGICLISKGIGRCRWLEGLGRHTLAILVMHKFPILLFQTLEPFKTQLLRFGSVTCLMLAMAVSALSILLCLFAEWVIMKIFPFILGDTARRSRIR